MLKQCVEDADWVYKATMVILGLNAALEEIETLKASLKEEKQKRAHGKFAQLICQSFYFIYWTFEEVQTNKTRDRISHYCTHQV